MKRLDVSHAFHSRAMEPMLDAFERSLAGIPLSPPSIPLFSNVTGDLVKEELQTPAYWRRHVREAVRFCDQITSVRQFDAPVDIFVEVGPVPALLQPVAECLGATRASLLAGSRGNGIETEELAQTLANLFVLGITLKGNDDRRPGDWTHLPTYPFRRERFWIDADLPVPPNAQREQCDPLLGKRLHVAGMEAVFQLDLRAAACDWIEEHCVQGHAVLPAAFYLAAAQRLAEIVSPDAEVEARDLTVEAPLIRGQVDFLQAVVQRTGDGEWTARFSSGSTTTNGTFRDHAHVRLARAAFQPPGTPWSATEAAATANADEIYRMFAERGLAYGPSFRLLTELRSSGSISVGTLPAADVQGSKLVALLDCVLQTTAGALRPDELTTARVPVGIDRCRIAKLTPGEVWSVHARMRPTSASTAGRIADILLFNSVNECVGVIEGVRLQSLSDGALEQWLRPEAAAVQAYHTEWRLAPETDSAPLSGTWILAGGPRDLRLALANEIRRAGGEVSDIVDRNFENTRDPRGVICLYALDAPATLPADESLRAVLRPAVESVQRLLMAGTRAGRLWLVTAGAHGGHDEHAAVQAAFLGLGNALTWEHPELGCVRADIERGPAGEMAAQLARLLGTRTAENQFRLAGGQVYVPRLVPHTASTGVPSSPNYRLTPPKSGRLDDLALLPCDRVAPAAGEVEIRVHTSGLNFRDVLVALSVYPGNVSVLGGECCGVVTRVSTGVPDTLLGTRVLALAAGAFCRYITVPENRVVPVPDSLSDDQAAGFSMVFLTAWYGLRVVARLQRGERVLIHAAAGGVGQAAIQIARAIGAEIWTTASNAKQDGLRAQGIEHVFDSRNVNAVRAIREAAGPRGVDVVLNCLTGEFIDASLELLNPDGRFVELGKADLRNPSDIAQRFPGIAYTAIDLAELDPAHIRSGLLELFDDLKHGQIAPVAVAPAPLEQAADVFRRMAQGGHTGKITFVHPPARDEILVRADRCYVVTGALGAIGRLVAERIVREGSGELVLISRRAPGPDTQEFVASLSLGHTRVCYRQADVADPSELERAIGGDACSLPIGGIFHAAGTLDDGVFSALAWNRFESVLAPKVRGSLNLLSATRRHPVDFVVLFSSAAAVIGGAGQANYAAANACMAALAQPGTTMTPRVLAVDWGPWADAGMAERAQATLGERWARLGIRRLAPQQALDLLWNALPGSASRLCVLDADMAALTSRLGYVPPLLSELVASPARAGNTAVKRPDWFARIASVPEADRPAFLRPWLEGVIREVLGGKLVGDFSSQQPLRDLGMDSLMAIELRNHIAAATSLSLPMSALFEHPSLDDLCRYIASHCETEPAIATASRPVPQIAETTADPIAIVGAACRFPGGVNTLDALWQLLETSGDAIEETPATRWPLDEWYDPDPQAPGKMYTRWMGALANIDQFDAGFFGISPVEAASLDPQQRLLLEVSWHALDHAGIPARTLAGSSTGVFIGISTNDYGVRHVFSRGARYVDAFSGIGNTSSAAAGRLAYVLGLEGPAMAVDTACSSSLVALHLAVRSLRAGETNLALVGGVNLILAPETTVYFCRLGAMARDGRCKTFDDSADGYVRSEGCGMVVLKRLSDALRDGDRVLAVLRGTAMNQDGRSNGLTAPNGAAQQAVIRAALTDARLRPNEIAYVEAHGTGTALGDAVEIDALRKVFVDAPRDRDLLIGSVKSNIGHLEAAAGMAGLLKAVLAVDRGKIPANVHLHSRNHNVSWDGLDAPQSLVAWPQGHEPRRAGISSFGFTGTNAHAIIEQVPVTRNEAEAPAQSSPLLLPVSARSPRALAVASAQMAGRLETAMPDEVGALCWNAGARRSHLEYRLAAHGEDIETLAAGLREQSAVTPRPALAEVRPIFVFSGQGSQWRGMGRGLLQRVPVFAEALREVDAALGRWLDWSAYDTLRNGDVDPGAPDRVQPLIFAMQVALARLWTHSGISPAAVIGHSLGEIAAAVTAGALSLDDAAKIIALRSRLTAQLSRDGGMLLVSARSEQIEQILSSLPEGVCLAARNSHASVVLSGDRARITGLGKQLRDTGVFTDLVGIAFASHSHHVEPVLADLRAGLEGIVFSPPRIPMRSTVTLNAIAGGEGPEYWQANLRQPVQFHQALQAEIALGRNLVIEVSPHPVLLQSIEQDLAHSGKLDEVRVLASMNRTRGDDALEFWQALAQAYAAGANLDWTRISGRTYPVVPLPPTAFERRSYWIDAAPSRGGVEAKRGLPGKRIESAGSEILFEGDLSTDSGDLAATVLGALAAVGLEIFPDSECAFRELRVSAGINRFPAGARAQTIVRKHLDGLSVSLSVKTGDQWEKIARGRLLTHPFAESATDLNTETIPACEHWDRARLRRACVNSGICLASAERVSAAEIGADFARFELQLAPDDDCVALACDLARLVMGERAWATPAGLEDLALRGRPGAGPATLEVRRTAAASVRLELSARDATWAIRAAKLVFRRISSPARPALVADIATSLGTQLRWHPAQAPRTGPDNERSTWLIQDDGSTLVRSLVERLENCGRTAMLVPAQASPEAWRSHAHAAAGESRRVTVVFTAPLHPASDVASPNFAASLLETFLTLDDAGLLARRGFHVLTRGAHDHSPIPEQAGLWGLGRVCSLERPEHWGKLIDLSADAHVGSLLDSLLSQDDEDQLRIGRRSREVLRLEPLREAPSDGSRALEGPVLITGGLGHLGRLLVEWLYVQGVRHVVLTGRRSLEQQREAVDWLERIRQKGQVDVHSLDAADEQAMCALFAAYREQGTPIRTAIHLAGESAPGPLETLTRESFERTIRGKVDGARVLIDCARREALDAVVLFSSAAATWGSAQMGAYALANASLDALAAAHNRDGLRVCSIAWGRWPRGGLMSAELETALDSIGLEALAPNAAFAAMRSALAGSLATLTVSSMDWTRFLDVYEARRTRPLLSMVSAGTLDSGAPDTSLLDSMRGLPRGEAIARANREVLTSLAHLLGLSPDAINPDRGFLDMGLTSLMAVELAKDLTRLAGRKLPATLAFEYPTPRQLAAHLIEQFLPAEPEDIPAASPIGLEEFTDDELAARLSDGIQTLKAQMQ
jgi:acyl transferase domain-containing protein/NADPH:quinone reductase-like Zn-dependent oxidoreductase/acyl carrier protein